MTCVNLDGLVVANDIIAYSLFSRQYGCKQEILFSKRGVPSSLKTVSFILRCNNNDDGMDFCVNHLSINCFNLREGLAYLQSFPNNDLNEIVTVFSIADLLKQVCGSVTFFGLLVAYCLFGCLFY